MTHSVAEDGALAASLVRAAGALAHRMQSQGVEGIQKTSPSDLVTAADHAAEELTVTRLTEERPSDGILGEEGTDHDGTNGRTWVLDPVDGTYNFVHGLTWWCSALALRHGVDVVLGAVHHPHDDVVWLGGRDLPTTRNGTPVAPIEDRSLADCSLATYLHPSYFAVPDVVDPFSKVVAGTIALRTAGSGSMDLAAVADGRIDLWCQHSVPAWDWMPGHALVEGAGGATTTARARGYTWSLAGPPTAVAQAAALLEES